MSRTQSVSSGDECAGERAGGERVSPVAGEAPGDGRDGCGRATPGDSLGLEGWSYRLSHSCALAAWFMGALPRRETCLNAA
jgi:hypothetical protein